MFGTAGWGGAFRPDWACAPVCFVCLFFFIIVAVMRSLILSLEIVDVRIVYQIEARTFIKTGVFLIRDRGW